MRRDAPSSGGSLPVFAGLQTLWITLGTAGLWLDARELFSGNQPDERTWMFGITLPGTLVSLWWSQIRHWGAALPMVAISTALHFVFYLLPLILLMGAQTNIFALQDYGYLTSFFALAYGCAIFAGLFLFRFIFKKETAQ